MTGGNDILELKFEGGDINPSIVKPHEIAELLVSFEKALLHTIKKQNPEIDTEQVLVSFESIHHQSLDLQFVPQLAQSAVLSSYLLIGNCISNGDYNQLDCTTITHLKTFVKFSKKHNCIGYLNHNGQQLSSFSASTEITLPKNKIIKEETTVFGELTEVGGTNPNVHLKINDEYTLIFATDKRISKLLAPKLWEKVKLSGIVKWNVETARIEEFKLIEILDYTPGNTYQAITELKRITNGHWDKFENNEDINNELLRD